ncbi:MAG: protein adenylyltransferase SelO family protein, partial [Polyangiales bacterium]
CDAVDSCPQNDELVGALFDDPAAFAEWAARWRLRLASEGRSSLQSRSDMQSVNPAFIPRNHRIEEVINAAVEEGDFQPFERLIGVLASPYEDQPSRDHYAAPPRRDQIVRQTFCGT